jgi:hypothetical protein
LQRITATIGSSVLFQNQPPPDLQIILDAMQVL